MNKTPNDKLLTIYKTDKITKNALNKMGKEVISHYENDLRKHFNKKIHNKNAQKKGRRHLDLVKILNYGGIQIWEKT